MSQNLFLCFELFASVINCKNMRTLKSWHVEERTPNMSTVSVSSQKSEWNVIPFKSTSRSIG